jgi:GH25 family lysozyme M1 (1,4-beta-N-acetylmuramidase)
MLKGIDISYCETKVDWNAVKSSGLADFVIIRAGYGKLVSQKDKMFESHYAGAKKAGIPVGCYWYSYATTADEARQEAEVCLSVIKGKQFEYPIYFDLEEQKAFATGKENCSAMVRAFCGKLEKAGCWAGLYMSRSPFNSYMEDDIKTKYALWLAEYSTKLNYDGEVGMWQYSSTGRVNGISGNVDLDIGYTNYPERVKSAGLNGYSKPDTQPISVPVSEPDENSVLDEILETVKRIDSKLD